MKLHDFRVLSFDCYGTLIDWETGILAGLEPLVDKAAPGLGRDQLLETFGRHESAQEAETPAMIYSKLLAVVHKRIAGEWGVTTNPEEDAYFGNSVGSWPAFEDTVAALKYLKQHYKLVILSNVDRASFAETNKRLEVAFDFIFTAEDIGSYKPTLRNFEYMLENLAKAGIGKKDILHTAESLFHDHAPANKMGLASAWIHRRHAAGGFGATAQPKAMPRVDFRFTSLGELAEAHRKEVATVG